MPFTYGPAEEEQVGQMMKAIVDSLKPFRAKRVPALLAAMALMRCLRAVMLKMPRRYADPFGDACVAMLKGESPDQIVTPFSSRFLQ